MGYERRLRRMSIPEETLIAILQGQVVITDFDVPEDTRVVRLYDDFPCKALGVIIESEAFEPVEMGREIPKMPHFALRQVRHA